MEEKREKKQKKVKIVYDVDGKMKKNKAKKNKEGGLGKIKVVPLIFFIIFEGIIYYFLTPRLNLFTPDLYIWAFLSLVILLICIQDYSSITNISKQNVNEIDLNKMKGFSKASKIILGLMGAIIGIAIVGSFISSKLVMSSKYANLINISEGSFETDIVESENINDIALMDTDTAKIIGSRAIGSLSDVVSQYEVSEDYSTIDYNGRPMKVAPLEYAGLVKFFNNRNEGIPGYVLVDPVKNDAKYIKLEKGIKYSPSAYFNYNLVRHVELQYPTYEFNGFYFELDNEGNPYYICPVLTPNAGLFGAKDVKGIVICDPCSGDCNYYSLGDVPNWVDRVYDGDLVCKKYDWYGMLSGGYWNSVFGNKGCKVTTDDYGYKVMDGDVWVYTGVTSVNGDESNIGFVLINLRNGESKYFPIAGAEEYSAMASAQGQVQNLGYLASFPSLINIKGIPTYIMVLKDNSGLVKMYALVNVEQYNIVATGSTQKEALAQYRELLAKNEIIDDSKTVNEETKNKKITVKDIKYVNVDNNTIVYITDTDKKVYKQDFAENEQLIFIQPNDVITVYYEENETGINELIDYE